MKFEVRLYSHFVIWLLQCLKVVDHYGNIGLIDRDEVRMVQETLNREELLLFLLLDDADVLAELDEITVIFLLSFLFFLLAQDQVDLISDSHSFVLFVIIDAVSYWISGLSLNQTSNLFLLLVHGLLSRN